MSASTRVSKPFRFRFIKRYYQNRYLMLLLLPALVYYLVFHYAPLYGATIAFKNYIFRLGVWGSPWVGFENFELLFHSPSFFEVFRNTILISLYKLVFGFPAPILFAMFLSELHFTKYKKVVQTISYFPHFVSWVVLGGLFMQLLSPTTGPINLLLKAAGIEPIYFLADPKWFRSILVITSIWKGIGWNSIVYLAAITSIDPQLYEAASIDGAGRIVKMFRITLPSIVPVITIMFIFAVGGIVNDDFDQIFNLYNPSVYKVGDVLSTYTYRIGLVDMKYSFSTAVGLFKNIIAFTLIVITNSITKRINDYGIW